MATDPTTSEPLATFDPALAAAVVTVLRRRGIAASEQAEPPDEVLVRVPTGRRDEAFAVVAAEMELIRDLASGDEPAPAPAPSSSSSLAEAQSAADEEGERVLVFEVLRRYGVVLVVVLAPLLIVTLSRPSMPLAFALAVVVGGAAAIVWWRDRDER